MNAFFIVSTILLLALLIALVITLSTNKKLLPTLVQKTLVSVPTQKTTYSEHNVATTRIICTKDFYSQLPQPEIIDNVHIPESIEEEYARLRLTDVGILEYTYHGTLLWKSSEPRTHFETVHSKAMLYSTPWKSSVSCGELSLSLVPLAIKRNSLIHWTFVSGFEPRCNAKPDCFVAEQTKLAMGGRVFLFSRNRRYRAALLYNGDLIVLNKQSEKPGSHVLKEELKSSLLSQLCE
jgi:hypothetical protein